MALRFVAILFPAPARFESHVPDAVLHGVLVPASRLGAEWLGRLRSLQQGRVQAYVGYTLAALIALLAWR